MCVLSDLIRCSSVVFGMCSCVVSCDSVYGCLVVVSVLSMVSVCSMCVLLVGVLLGGVGVVLCMCFFCWDWCVFWDGVCERNEMD